MVAIVSMVSMVGWRALPSHHGFYSFHGFHKKQNFPLRKVYGKKTFLKGKFHLSPQKPTAPPL